MEHGAKQFELAGIGLQGAGDQPGQLQGSMGDRHAISAEQTRELEHAHAHLRHSTNHRETKLFMSW